MFTQPDKPKNRGMKLIPTPVKEAATEAGMSQPSDSQIYYIDLSEPDSATVYSQEESGFGKILSMLGQGICTVVEYFR